ncbi:unnamed protein product [Coregonus sp. 'balchen']|nr:unnamed protein product [Coregonus sp. 'balchen']
MVDGVEGDSITLSCSYTGSVNNLQWHHQYPRCKPEFTYLDMSLLAFCVRMSLILLLLLSVFVGDSMEQETIIPVKPEVNALQGTDITLSCNYKGNVNNLQRCEDLTPLKKEEYCLEGTPVTLSYNYSRTATGGGEFYWYHQDTAQRPTFLLYISCSEFIKKVDLLKTRISVKLNKEKKHLDLEISSAEVTDSALYYCAVITTCTGDHVQQQPGGVIATEGGLVTLSCQYNTSANNAYLYWYKQEANDFPKHMLSRYSFGSGENATGFKERFDASLNAKTQSVPLMIWRVQLSDSAVYYCALKPTVTGNVGTLNGQTIEPTREEEYAPAGSNITLSWTYSSAVSLQWYLQDPGSAPQYILLILHGVGSSSRAPGLDPRLSVKLNDEKNCVDLETLLFLFLTIFIGVSYEDLTPLKKEEYCLEGTPVTLSYNYSRTATGGDELYWYHQDTAQRPKFLLYISGSGFVKKADPLNTQISAKLNEEKNRLDLEISSAEVSDSALYYCAVRPTVKGNLNTLYKNLSRVHISRNLFGEEAVDQQSGHVTALEGGLVTLSCNYTTSKLITGDHITPVKSRVICTEGESVTLSCSYDTSSDNILLYWYQQYPKQAPHFLLVKYLAEAVYSESAETIVTAEPPYS